MYTSNVSICNTILQLNSSAIVSAFCNLNSMLMPRKPGRSFFLGELEKTIAAVTLGKTSLNPTFLWDVGIGRSKPITYVSD